ncbi:MAG: hypothetical protein HEQ35_27690 [Gloeotrichia echinulata IR180]|jgi:hypothetical protein|nr:hypothetical protein [Gloeotrichia echinulata DEX184]
MSILPRVPWVSLVLVLLSYSTLGWVLSETKASGVVWLAVVFAVLFLLFSLATPSSSMTQFRNVLFKSNTRTFIVAVFAAFMLFVMVAWFRVFLDGLLVISAAILARIDFQAAGFREVHTFWMTSIFSLAGLGLGAALHLGFIRHFW